MDVLHFGSTGNAGSAIQAKLIARGHHVDAMLRKDVDLERLTQVEECIRWWSKQHRGGTILYSAGLSDIDACQRSEWHSCQLNAAAPALLAIFANQANCRMVYISTDQVFGNFNGQCFYGHHEDDLVGQDCWPPVNTYGEHKAQAEAAVRLARSHLIVRTQWLYGGIRLNWFDQTLRFLQAGQTISALSEYRGRPTHVDDFAKALITLLEENPTRSVYHLVADGPPVSRLQVAGLMAYRMGLCPADHVRRVSMQEIFRTPRTRRALLRNTRGPTLPRWDVSLTQYVRQAASKAA